MMKILYHNLMIVISKFIDFLLYLNQEYKSIIKVDDDMLSKLQNDIIKYIKQINNTSLREICVFFTDDFFIKKFENWKNFLVEKSIFKTNSGGGVFFERFDQYLIDCDYEMSVIYLTSMQIGFTGYLDDSQEEYNKYFNKFKRIFPRQIKKIKTQSYEYQYFEGNTRISVIIILMSIVVLFPVLQNTYYIISMFNELNAMYGGLGV